jgi:ribosomal protein L12E/L44/L45/RPP1/RPP2
LISEGSSKLASVPSGGSGGGSAPAAGGAASGGAVAEDKPEEKKEEGTSIFELKSGGMSTNIIYREGRV